MRIAGATGTLKNILGNTLKFTAGIIFVLFCHQGFAQDEESYQFRIEGQNGGRATIVEVVEVEQLEKAFAHMVTDTAKLSDSAEIVFADDFGAEGNFSRDTLLRDPRIKYVRTDFLRKLTAVESIKELEVRYPGLSSKLDDYRQKAEAIRQEKEIQYRKHRGPATLVKVAGIFGANYFLFSQRLEGCLLPLILWAAYSAAEGGIFGWNAPEIANDYERMSRKFLRKFEWTRQFDVSDENDESGVTTKTQRFVKRAFKLAVPGLSVTFLYHLVSQLGLAAIVGFTAPDIYVKWLADHGHFFSHFGFAAFAMGLLSSVPRLAGLEVPVDVLPTTVLQGYLRRAGYDKHSKRLAMMWGSAIIGGYGTVINTAAEKTAHPWVTHSLVTLTALGAATLLYKYAIKDLFTPTVRAKIENDLTDKVGHDELQKILGADIGPREEWLARAQARERAGESAHASATDTPLHLCIYLLKPRPVGFLTGR